MVDYKGWIKKQESESDSDYENYHIKKLGMSGYIPKESFFIDGIICEEEYKNAGNKVLYIAKECNAWEYDKQNVVNKENRLNMSEFFARKELKKGDKTKNRFLKGMAMLHNAIINNDYSTPNKNISSLSSAAMINLNKRGGYSWCIWNTLEKYVEEYQEYLRNQISAINPDVIVCCGESVRDLVNEYSLAEGCKDIRCAYHPSCFSVSDSDKLKFLNKKQLDIVKAEHSQSSQTENPKIDARGYIFDTNNRWKDQGPEQDMLVNKRACAYGNATKQLSWFREGDYVLFYSSVKKGIIAVGKAIKPGRCDKTDTEWWEVEPEVPKDFNNAYNNDNNKKLPMDEVNKIVYGNETDKKICMRGTVKRKIIKEEQVKMIIEKLKKEYNEM